MNRGPRLTTRTVGAILSPWFSFAASGFIPRIIWRNPATGLDEDFDGPEAFSSYEQALEASRFLRPDAAPAAHGPRYFSRWPLL